MRAFKTNETACGGGPVIRVEDGEEYQLLFAACGSCQTCVQRGVRKPRNISEVNGVIGRPSLAERLLYKAYAEKPDDRVKFMVKVVVETPNITGLLAALAKNGVECRDTPWKHNDKPNRYLVPLELLSSTTPTHEGIEEMIRLHGTEIGDVLLMEAREKPRGNYTY